MDRCLNCQFYDRQHEKSACGKTLRSGQCRRTAPMLNPAQAKSYTIEGVWPTVRDDDWCGEWKASSCRTESHRTDPVAIASGALHAVHGIARAAPINVSGTITVASGSPMIALPPTAAARIGGE